MPSAESSTEKKIKPPKTVRLRRYDKNLLGFAEIAVVAKSLSSSY